MTDTARTVTDTTSSATAAVFPLENSEYAQTSPQTKSNSLLMFDGEKYQLNAILRNVSKLNDEAISCVKLPAACCMDFPPNDKMKSFSLLKARLNPSKI